MASSNNTTQSAAASLRSQEALRKLGLVANSTPVSLISKHVQNQSHKLADARRQIKSITSLLREIKFNHQVKSMPTTLSRPRPVSVPRVLSPTSRPGANITLPNIHTGFISPVATATVTRVEYGSPHTVRWEPYSPSRHGPLGSLRSEPMSPTRPDNMPGNMLPVRTSSLPHGTKEVFCPRTNRATADLRVQKPETLPQVQSVTFRPYTGVATPTSRPGATVVLPNGRIAVVKRVEVSKPLPMVNNWSSTRVVQSSAATTPTSRVGATIMLPNGRIATVTRVSPRDATSPRTVTGVSR